MTLTNQNIALVTGLQGEKAARYFLLLLNA